MGSLTFEEYRKEVSKRMYIGKYVDLLACYTSSFFSRPKVFSEQKLIWLKMILE